MDEYVSKSYLITKFNELADKYARNEHKRQRALAYATAADMIELIDTADVQPVVHGYWEECEIRGTLTQSCSVCGSDCGVLYPYDFCPNCGARMDLKDGDTNGW